VADDYHARTPTLAVALRRCLARMPGALGFILLTTLIVVGVLVLGALAMATALIILPTSSVTAGGPGVFLALIAGVATAVAVVYLTMRWAPAFPAMIEEEIGMREALRRSWHLSGDNVWRILVIALVGALATALFSSLLAGVFSLLLVDLVAPVLGLDDLVAESIGLALGALLLAPLVPVLTAVLYFDLRARRDPARSSAGAGAR
jgi:membrane-anchored glycerophosphoryl diester phosphodiesterase (GDPDase)